MATDGYKTAKALRRGEVEFWQRGDFTVTIIYSRLAPSGVKTKPGYIVSVIYLRNAPRQWFHDSLAEARAHFKVEVQDNLSKGRRPMTNWSRRCAR